MIRNKVILDHWIKMNVFNEMKTFLLNIVILTSKCDFYNNFEVGTGATVATLADASELPGTVTVAQVNYSTVTDGEVTSTCFFIFLNIERIHFLSSLHFRSLVLFFHVITLYSYCFSQGGAKLGHTAR